MKNSEVKEMIRTVWFEQSERCSKDPLYPLLFYTLLENQYSHLLNFKYKGDKYQLIKTWVQGWQKFYCDN